MLFKVKKGIKKLTLGKIISKKPGIRFSPETEANTLWERDLWSGSFGSYLGSPKTPYVILETRVLTKWSR